MKSTNAKFSGSIILLSIINEAEFIFYVLIHTLYSSNLITGKKFVYFFEIATARLYIECSVRDEKINKNLILESKDFLTTAMEEIRKLSKTLIAPTLGMIGLKGAVNEILENIEQVNEVQFITQWDDEDESLMDDKLKLTVFRIIQEQLNNIIKHASAKVIAITINQKACSLRLTIKDDGIGFDTSKKRKGLGLQNIISRTGLYSGTVNINSAPGEGCELIIDFPIDTISNMKIEEKNNYQLSLQMD